MEFQSFTWSRNVFSTIYLLTFLSLGAFNPINANESIDQKSEDKKIAYLIEEVRKSNAIFIRNGDHHQCEEAAEHLEGKMKRARRTFGFFGSMAPMSAKTFIDKIASQSSMSGKNYKIKFPKKEAIPTRKWLYQKLKNKYPVKQK